MRISTLLLLFVWISWVPGCVSSRKYQALVDSKAQLEREYDALRAVREQLRDLENTHRRLGEQLAVCQQELDRRQQVIDGLGVDGSFTAPVVDTETNLASRDSQGFRAESGFAGISELLLLSRFPAIESTT